MLSAWTALAIVTACQAVVCLAMKPWRKTKFSGFLLLLIFSSVLANALLLTFHVAESPSSIWPLLTLWGIVPVVLFGLLKWSDPGMPPVTREQIWKDIVSFAGPCIALAIIVVWLPCGKGASSACRNDPNHFPSLLYRQLTMAQPFSSWTWSAMIFWAVLSLVYFIGGYLIGRKLAKGAVPTEEQSNETFRYQILVAILLAASLFCWWKSMDEPPMFHEDPLTGQMEQVQ